MTNLKSTLIAVILLTVGANTYAQTNKFEIGVEGGAGLTFLRGNTIIDTLHKPTIGFSVGLAFQYQFKKIVSVRTGVAFERKGSVLNSIATDAFGNPLGEITVHTNFDYLTIPVLIRATFGKKVQYFVNAGPYVGYLLKQTYVGKGENIPTTTSNNTSLYKPLDIGISTGLGLSFSVKTKFSLSLEIRNNLGLTNISDVPVVNNGAIKTNSTNLLIGFTYKLDSFQSQN